MSDFTNKPVASVDFRTGGDRDAEQYLLNNPVRERYDRRADCRFVVFNTGETTASDFRTVIRTCLGKVWADSLNNVSRIVNGKTPPRMELSIIPEKAETFRKILRETFSKRDPSLIDACALLPGFISGRNSMPKYWRIAEYKPFRARRRHSGEAVPPGDMWKNIASWNVNGFQSKTLQITDFMYKEKVGVIGVQETLHNSARYPLRVQGYSTFSIDRQEGFRGQAILVREYYPAYRIPHAEPQILHVKISQWGLSDGSTTQLHIISIYLPSGGNRRSERKRILVEVFNIKSKILKSDCNANIIVLGDYNMTREDLDKLVRREVDVDLIKTCGAPFTRFPTGDKDPSALDHVIATSTINLLFKKPRVCRSYRISDHRPILMRSRGEPILEPPRKIRVNLDRAKMNERRQEIVSSNRWSAIADIESLDEQVNSFNVVATDTLKDVGVWSQAIDKGLKPCFPKKLKSLLSSYKAACKNLAKNPGEGRSELERTMKTAKHKFRKEKRQWEKEQAIKHYKHIGEDMLSGDLRSAWNRLGTKVHRGTLEGKGNPLHKNQPLRDKEGTLQTDPVKVNKVMAEHYRSLHQDDPRGFAREPRFWANAIPELEMNGTDRERPGFDHPPYWSEVLVAIRSMNRDTSPGKDGLHINMFKGMVREESMLALQANNPGRTRWENINVDLPEEDLPTYPLSAMGKAVFAIITNTWVSEVTPSAWQQNTVISLLKGGDPEDPNNYRGITLISVLQKILSVIIVKRLYGLMTAANLFDKNQGGFRPHEEAISQFVALAEIVRRRYNMEMPRIGSYHPTLVAFIDLKKAYDKVPLELVLAVMRKMGIPDKIIRLIRSMYLNTEIVVRTGDIESEPYELWRGLRQGCPLSPALFIIMITGILEFLSPEGGVGTPWEELNAFSAGSCAGLLYADDMLKFEDDLKKLRDFLVKFVEWCEKWWMAAGLDKCGIMLFTKDEKFREQYRKYEFRTEAGVFEKVESYKYMGIRVEQTLPTSRTVVAGSKANEDSHVSELRKKGLRTLHQIRPALIDEHCPLTIKIQMIRTFLIPVMVYGAEWLGFRKLNCFPLQRVVDAAVLWSIGLRGKTNLTSATVVRLELGLPSIEEEFAAARTRLYLKSKNLETTESATWLGRLSKSEKKVGRESSWVFTSRKEIAQLRAGATKYAEDEDQRDERPLRRWAEFSEIVDMHTKANRYRSTTLEEIGTLLHTNLEPNIGSINDYVESRHVTAVRLMENLNQGLEMTHIKQNASSGKNPFVLLIRRCRQEEIMTSDRSIAFREWYDKYGFGATRTFIRFTMRRSDLREGVRWLVATRTRAFPDVERQWLAARAAGRTPEESARHRCPLCGKHVNPGWDWGHLAIRCSNMQVKALQAKYLEGPVRLIAKELTLAPDNIRNEKVDALGHFEGISVAAIAVYLLGGNVMGYHGCSYTYGFGTHDQTPWGMITSGWVPVAEFLQQVMPLWSSRLGLRIRDDLRSDEVL